MPQWDVLIPELDHSANRELWLAPLCPDLPGSSFASPVTRSFPGVGFEVDREWMMTGRPEVFKRPVPNANFTVRSKWRTAGMAAGLTGVMGAVAHRIDCVFLPAVSSV